ncbi:hypothetical protein HOA55_01985 [archaeon]|jgi:hypothetical protein|nr:hypothetical protein [archaeon]MBT6820101.1 hypothetical protein [archaeon]MBT7025382.1 hypothetical protein [archaeon]MBT7568153.1 hypothetical protein [archaeon]MBT7705969.1 hypothetical protein [archaeon]
MERKPLTPKTVIDIEGKISYAESFQSWNMLRLKREIVEEFPILKEKRSSFSYRLMFCRSHEDLMKMVKGLKSEAVMPLVLWMYKD